MANAIGVLSRADEIGAGRLDALISARRVARRYAADPMLRQLCQTVVPVAGLLAETGRTLRQDEYLALEGLARIPRPQTEDMLLSVDRFIRGTADTGLSPDVRAALVDRLGLFGVRLSLVVIRAGMRDATALAEELLKRSGLGAVRQLLVNQFAERRTVLKSRSALLALDRTSEHIRGAARRGCPRRCNASSPARMSSESSSSCAHSACPTSSCRRTSPKRPSASWAAPGRRRIDAAD